MQAPYFSFTVLISTLKKPKAMGCLVHMFNPVGAKATQWRLQAGQPEGAHAGGFLEEAVGRQARGRGMGVEEVGWEPGSRATGP